MVAPILGPTRMGCARLLRVLAVVAFALVGRATAFPGAAVSRMPATRGAWACWPAAQSMTAPARARVPSSITRAQRARLAMGLAPAHTAITEWVVANGGFVHPALRAVDRGEAGVGLTLAEPAAAGAVLVAIPPRLQITTARLAGDEAAAVELEVPPNKWDVKLALALLTVLHDANSVGHAPSAPVAPPPTRGFGAAPPKPQQRGSGVAWQTYADTLPDSLASLPLFFTGAMLREFEAEFPAVTGEVGGRVQLLKSVASALPKQGAFADLNLRKLAWAFGIVSSRAVRLHGAGEAGVLAPLLDLANHDFDASAQVQRLGDQKQASSAAVPPAVAKMPGDSACLVATRPLEAGEDVTLTYGAMSNADLILEYGFRVPNNPHDEQTSPFAAGASGGVAADALQFVSEEEALTVATVDKVLDSVRPYLIADGGNCRVVSVDADTGDVALLLVGACGSCPSATVTLKNGLEKALREAFGSRLGAVVQVDNDGDADQGVPDALTVKTCVDLLAPVAGAIKGLGGAVDIISVDAGTVRVSYQGPDKLRVGIEMTLKDDERVAAVVFD